jgi:MFS family permease
MSRSGRRAGSGLAGSEAGVLLGASVLARLPLAMVSIALLVHVHHLTGSFAPAGLVTGAYAAAEAVGAPLLGRLVDRFGQTLVLLASAAAAAVLLAVVGLLPRETSAIVLVALAALIGLATPPLGACVRTLLPGVVDGDDALRAAYAIESSALELTFIAGPPLALAVGAVWSTGASLVAAAAVLLVATVGFAAQPASRRWRPDNGRVRARGGALRVPAIRTLVVVLGAVGIVFGAVEVGVTDAANAHGGASIAGPLLALWGVGSLIGGVLAARRGGGARTGRGLVPILVALMVGHLALAGVATNIFALGAVLVLAGAAIAPTYATVYSLVDRIAPDGTVTEAFAWLGTAVTAGAAVGVASGGALTASAGPAAAFLLAGVAGAAAVAVAVAHVHRLGADPSTEPSALPSAAPSAAPPRAVPLPAGQ